MASLPQDITDLMQSDAYKDSNHPDHKSANEKVDAYFKSTYPGEARYDATGRMDFDEEYDMTLEEYQKAQADLDAAFEMDEDELGSSYTIEQEVIAKVRVLYPDGSIITEELVASIAVSMDDDKEDEDDEDEKIYVWVSGGGCEVCDSMAGTILDSSTEAGNMHPNCSCSAEEITKKEYKKMYGEPDPEKQERLKKLNDQKKFNEALWKTLGFEGGKTDGKDQVKDNPTNLGITQPTLDSFNKEYPEKGFPDKVDDLYKYQASEIYKTNYWDNTRIPDIENDRIRNATFDMNVMSGANITGATMQNALNSSIDARLRVDGIMGNQTIKAINSIPENQVSSFMDTLKKERISSLQGMINWPTAQGGWTTRTMAY